MQVKDAANASASQYAWRCAATLNRDQHKLEMSDARAYSNQHSGCRDVPANLSSRAQKRIEYGDVQPVGRCY